MINSNLPGTREARAGLGVRTPAADAFVGFIGKAKTWTRSKSPSRVWRRLEFAEGATVRERDFEVAIRYPPHGERNVRPWLASAWVRAIEAVSRRLIGARLARDLIDPAQTLR